MVNITHKVSSLREAIATAILKVSKQETIDAIEQRKVPKGDVFEFSRAAGLLAIKKTSDVIPDCHPLPVEFAAIKHTVEGLNIIITVEVHTIYKTGVEVEAMHGASITALTMYDMLKPIDKEIEISTIKLEKKKGGKTDFKDTIDHLRCAVIVCSDTISAGEKEDRAGKAIMQKLQQSNINLVSYEIIPDEVELIRSKALQLTKEGFNLVLFTGGTGLSPAMLRPKPSGPCLPVPFLALWKPPGNMGSSVRHLRCSVAVWPVLSMIRWCLPCPVLPGAPRKQWMRFSRIYCTFSGWQRGFDTPDLFCGKITTACCI